MALEVVGQRTDELFHLDHGGSYRPAAAAARIKTMMRNDNENLYLEAGGVEVVAIAYDGRPRIAPSPTSFCVGSRS